MKKSEESSKLSFWRNSDQQCWQKRNFDSVEAAIAMKAIWQERYGTRIEVVKCPITQKHKDHWHLRKSTIELVDVVR